MFHGTKKSAPGVSNIKSKFESDKGTRYISSLIKVNVYEVSPLKINY